MLSNKRYAINVYILYFTCKLDTFPRIVPNKTISLIYMYACVTVVDKIILGLKQSSNV